METSETEIYDRSKAVTETIQRRQLQACFVDFIR